MALAHVLADAAGEVLRARFRKPLNLERKGDSSPVTEADRAAESAMAALIRARFPDHGIFGEEHARENAESRWQWVLDPIDGTRAFLAGYPTFTTLIALCLDGAPVLGVIDQPFLRERWTAEAGGVTLLNGERVRAQARRLEDAVLATTSSDYFTPAQAAAYAKLRARCASAIAGGDAYASAMLASGCVGAVVDAALKPYDYCALVPIVEGAGGVITDWRGKPLTLDSDGSLAAACCPEAHRAMLAELGKQ